MGSGYHVGSMHLQTGWERTSWTADRHREKKERIARRIAMSRYAHETRRPGQTLQSRMRELDAEAGGVVAVPDGELRLFESLS